MGAKFKPEEIILHDNEPREIVNPPDPGCEVIQFLSWLKKRGAMKKLSQCIMKWEKEGFVIENIIRTLGIDIIRIYRNRGGKKVVVLLDKVWADQWMRHYQVEIPHHRQTLPLERIVSKTEKKRKV